MKVVNVLILPISKKAFMLILTFFKKPEKKRNNKLKI